MKDIKTPVNNTAYGFKYWQRNLRSKVYDMLMFDGLPDSLPQKELMYRLIVMGFAPIFYHDKYGWVTATGSLSGVDMYNHATQFVYSQPVLGSGTLTIGENVAYIYLNKEFLFSRYKMQNIIDRYASMLSDVESTLVISTINERINRLFTCNDGPTRDEMKRVMDAVRAGETAVVTQPMVVKMIDKFEFPSEMQTITDMLNLRDSLVKAFMTEIGVNYSMKKAERYITAELNANDQLLSVNSGIILDDVKESVEWVNNVLGLKISVKLNENYDNQAFDDGSSIDQESDNGQQEGTVNNET